MPLPNPKLIARHHTNPPPPTFPPLPPAGHAIVYECVKTITAIFPNQQLIEVAADLVARFLRSKSHNLRVRLRLPLSHPQFRTYTMNASPS